MSNLRLKTSVLASAYIISVATFQDKPLRGSGHNDVKSVGNEGDQIAEGVRAGGVAVEEEDRWARWVPGFAVEDIEVVSLGLLVLDNEGYNE